MGRVSLPSRPWQVGTELFRSQIHKLGLPFSSLYQASQARGFEGGEDWGVPMA